MTERYPAEVFGFPVDNRSREAEKSRRQHRCPFVAATCNKQSRLIAYPMGVCSACVNGQAIAICPRRFLERQTVFRDIALDYYGSTTDLLLFSKVKLQGVGSFDYVLVRHKPMSSEIDDFVIIEFQTDQTTGTGKLVDALQDFVDGKDVTASHYAFGLNTYDTLKRSYTQMLNKGVAIEYWGQRVYWVLQRHLFDNLAQRYQPAFTPGSSNTNVFAIYDLVHDPDEVHNLASDPRLARVLADMEDRLDRWMESTGDPLLPDGQVAAPPGARVNDPDGQSPLQEPRIVP